MENYNPKLRSWLENKPSTDAGVDNIQVPGQVPAIIWQHREHEQSAYELDLVKGLLQAFQEGADTPARIVATLNDQGLRTESGDKWTADFFEEEMARLGY